MAELTLGHYPLTSITARLERFARECGRGGRSSRYILFGNVLLNEARVLAQPALMMKIMSHHRKLVKVDVPLTAQFILVTSNIRIVGLAGNARVGAKVRAGDTPEPLFREFRARRIFGRLLADVAGVALPRLIDRDRRNGQWLIEEHVSARHVCVSEMADFIVNHAENVYAPTVRLHPAQRALSGMSADVATVMPRFETLVREAAWPVAFCHGDLQPKNLLVGDDGGFWLVDLELARPKPVAIELASACIAEQELEPAALSLLARPAMAAVTLSPQGQLALGLAAHLEGLRGRREVDIEDRMAATRKSRAAAAAEVDGAYRKVVTRAQTLAASA